MYILHEDRKDTVMTGDAFDEDFYKGDPAKHVLGAREEIAARVHAPQPPKPRHSGTKTIAQVQREIRDRIYELSPVVEEYNKLEKAAEALKGI